MQSGAYTVSIEGTLERAKTLPKIDGLMLLMNTFNMHHEVAFALLMGLINGQKNYEIKNNTLTVTKGVESC